MNKIHKLFNKTVFEFKDEGEEEINSFKEEIEDLHKKHRTYKTSSLHVNSSHRSIQSIHRLPTFKPLSKEILKNCKEFMNEYGYEEFLQDRLFITNMWFNISGQGDYLFPHTHPGCFISGAYYVESDESHFITFHDMMRNLLQQPSYPTKTGTDVEMLPCTPGTMYLFSSDFVHSVSEQREDSRKIVISFNLCLEDGPKFR